MRILVTGGAGFLGYELIFSLLSIGINDGRKPVRVTVIENFKRGRKSWFDSLVCEGKIALVESDISLPL